MDHPSWSELFQELGVFRIIRQFRLLRSVQVIEGAVELVKAVEGRQVFVLVSQVVLPELAGSVPQWFKQRCNCGIFLLHAEVGSRHSHLAEAGAKNTLAHDESCTASGAALLGVVVGEYRSFFGNTINVGGFVAHHPFRICADVALSDVVTPYDDNVWFLGGCRWVDGAYQSGNNSQCNQSEI